MTPPRSARLAYTYQRLAARKYGIPWQFDFGSWRRWWQANGWDRRRQA